MSQCMWGNVPTCLQVGARQFNLHSPIRPPSSKKIGIFGLRGIPRVFHSVVQGKAVP